MKLDFRKIRADEVDLRVGQIGEKGLTLLLYKDARCDMNILDEAVGQTGWKREHSRDNANCIVSIYDSDIKEWVQKEDTGTESNTEREKGLASDSFKRACVNWGIGRELYTAPFIWISNKDCTIKPNPRDNKKLVCYDKFIVDNLEYDDNGNISYITIMNMNLKRRVYQFGKHKETSEERQEIEEINKDKSQENDYMNENYGDR